MVVEIVAGIAFGSMALLADGLHMASHSVALGISAFAYVYARRRARDPRFSFGTGKVNALGGFAGAILLAVFVLLMVVESVARILEPVMIAFDQAIAVAIVGLLVNGVSVGILGHAHDASEESAASGEQAESHDEHPGHHHDHNLRAAYFHVLADALTSVLAIVALLAGKYFAMSWLDPAMGIVGAILVARWSVGLVRLTGAVLLDRQASASVLDAVRQSFEGSDAERVVDLHVWSIGPGIRAAEITVVSPDPKTAEEYKARIPRELRIVHVTVEVHDRES